MFDALIEVATAAKKLDENKILQQVMSEPLVQAQILDLNKAQMYEKGVNAEGKSMGDYAPFTVEYKISVGQRHDHITLKDTGKMYDSMRVKAQREETVITANTVKERAGKTVYAGPGDKGIVISDLDEQYGPILGLTDESKEQILPEITERFLEKTRAALQG